MTPPDNLSQIERDALVACLRIAAARGRAIRDAQEQAATPEPPRADAANEPKPRKVKTRKHGAEK